MDKDPKKHIEGLSWEEILKLVEQLQDDQSELEAQNSELRRTLKNKDRSLKNYADHYDFAPVGYLSLSSDGLILAVNLAGCQLLGEERRNLFHRPVADFLDPGSEEAFRNHLQRVFYTEESDVCQVKVHYKTGSYDIELRSAVVRDSETDAPYCRSSMYNITGRLKMEAELDEQRRLTGAVFEHIESGIIVCNREGKVTLLNKAASNLFRHDLTGFRCQDWHSHLRLFREEEQVPLNEEAEAIFHGWKGERFENVEVNYVPGEGRVHTLLASGQSISQPQGLNLGAIIVLHDITDRKRAEDELRYYQDQLEKLVEERTQDLKSANNRLAEEIAERSRLQNKLVMEKNFAESLINSQPGLFYLMNKKGEMLRWNKNMELYTGYSRNEIKEMQALNLLTEEDVNLTRQMLDETLQYRKGFGKARLATKNGKKISFLLTGVAIEHDGEDYIIGTGIDISELERERKEKMRFFQVLEKSMNEIYI
ncbi:MAG: PAS domain S-box protein, partial [Balneolales bacterium]